MSRRESVVAVAVTDRCVLSSGAVVSGLVELVEINWVYQYWQVRVYRADVDCHGLVGARITAFRPDAALLFSAATGGLLPPPTFFEEVAR